MCGNTLVVFFSFLAKQLRSRWEIGFSIYDSRDVRSLENTVKRPKLHKNLQRKLSKLGKCFDRLALSISVKYTYSWGLLWPLMLCLIRYPKTNTKEVQQNNTKSWYHFTVHLRTLVFSVSKNKTKLSNSKSILRKKTLNTNNFLKFKKVKSVTQENGF